MFLDPVRAHPVCPQRGPYEASEGTYPDRGQEELDEDKCSHLDTLALLNGQ